MSEEPNRGGDYNKPAKKIVNTDLPQSVRDRHAISSFRDRPSMFRLNPSKEKIRPGKIMNMYLNMDIKEIQKGSGNIYGG